MPPKLSVGKMLYVYGEEKRLLVLNVSALSTVVKYVSNALALERASE